MFLGWGKKSKEWQLDSGEALVASWSYFSLFFCPVSRSTRWFIVGDRRSQDQEITLQQLEQMFPEDPPKVPLWDRYGLWMILAGYLAIAMIAGVFLPSETV